MNVMQSAKTLYRALDKDNRTTWLELARNKYKKCKPHGDWIPTLEWLNALLEGYDPVTKYVYANEVPRKRDRFVESVISTGQRWTDGREDQNVIVSDAAGKAKECKKALGYWVRMTAHYSDAVSDATTLKAFEDANVERVVWHTVEDDKVCTECAERDGMIFEINDVPPKPHWGCRCYLRPYVTAEE